MNTVRAKFTVNSIARNLTTVWKDGANVAQEVQTAKLSPVYGGSEENKAFFASTPSGSIEVGYINPGLFELGKTYYVDFIPADQ